MPACAPTTPGATAFTVLTDADLFSRVVNFQAGRTLPLLLRWRELQPPNKSDFVTALLKEGDLATLERAMHEFWYEHRTLCFFQVPDLKPAIATGDPAVLQWAMDWTSHDSGLNSHRPDLWVEAIKTFPGHCGILQLLHEHRPLSQRSKSFLRAMFASLIIPSVTLVRWLVANIGHDSLPESMLQRAALHGDLELVTCLLGVTGQRLQPRTYSLIYRQSRDHDEKEESELLRQVLCYLLNHCRELHDAALEQMAVADVDIPMLELIQQARGLKHITSNMVTTAAEHGHLSMIRMFLEANPSLLMSDAVDEAVYRGNRDILEYLYSMGTTRSSPDTVDYAVLGDRVDLDLIQLIYEHERAAFSEETMNNAASKQHWDVVDFLVDKHPEYSTKAVAESAISANRLDLVQRYSNAMDFTQIQRLVNAASFSGNTEIIQYLEARERQLQQKVDSSGST